jgi:hypothetical protein
MIEYTANLGKCLYDAKLFICYTHVYMKVSYVWVILSRGDDAINRMMLRVVATVVRVSRDVCRASRLLYYFMHNIHTMRVWAKMDFLQVHNSAIM